ncbi:CBS domain-containing protein [Singulisphaera sp. GP187]|uniref:CBS domain-containing protein n=1 Tax=Singulisphaera sp. GP187 TaxID=1882752 RepID=UPI0009265F7C|nr:CBS domain-containing protein [Singulisphaera sp. GP187]SIO60013.1 CBS domain-containing protein [Singulisphaera sp. GP187]
MQVRDVLKSKGGQIISIQPEATVTEAIARMVQNNIGSLPIVDAEDHLIGIISERDLLRGIHNHGEKICGKHVAEFMTRDPVTCELDANVNDVMGQMSERRIAKVPVLSGAKLVGIVSVGDVIKVLYDTVQSENQHLMSYIHGSM